MAQIITIFCEGPHDVAFIYRMLKTIEYKSYDSCKIGGLPVPFNQLIIQEVEKSDVENLNLMEVRKGFLPSKVMQKEDKYIFIYSIGGDSKTEARKKMIADLLTFIPEPGEISVVPDNTNFSVIYLFDADSKGVDSRLNDVNEEVNAVLETKGEINLSSNGSLELVYQISFGALIFTGSDNKTGTLESVLLPLMEEDNEDIFEAAKHFIDDNHDYSRLFPLKIKVDPETNLAVEQRSTRAGDKYRFYESKSVIGTVGQLQCSGKSNVVCISDSDYITIEKIRRNAKCSEIMDFLVKI